MSINLTIEDYMTLLETIDKQTKIVEQERDRLLSLWNRVYAVKKELVNGQKEKNESQPHTANE